MADIFKRHLLPTKSDASHGSSARRDSKIHMNSNKMSDLIATRWLKLLLFLRLCQSRVFQSQVTYEWQSRVFSFLWAINWFKMASLPWMKHNCTCEFLSLLWIVKTEKSAAIEWLQLAPSIDRTVEVECLKLAASKKLSPVPVWFWFFTTKM